MKKAQPTVNVNNLAETAPGRIRTRKTSKDATHGFAARPRANGAHGWPSVRCACDEIVSLDRLQANPRNPNKHPEAQLGLYAKAIQHQGWRRAVVISKRSGYIVTGHGAVETARQNGWPSVPVDYQDFDSDADET